MSRFMPRHQIIAADEFRIFLGSGDGAYLQQVFFAAAASESARRKIKGPIAAGNHWEMEFSAVPLFRLRGLPVGMPRTQRRAILRPKRWPGCCTAERRANPVGLITLARNEPLARYFSGSTGHGGRRLPDQTAGQLSRRVAAGNRKSRSPTARALTKLPVN